MTDPVPEIPSEREAVARAVCWTIGFGCDGECAIAGRCKGGPAPMMFEIADAAIATSRAVREAAGYKIVRKGQSDD